jgi:hypothetical protein
MLPRETRFAFSHRLHVEEEGLDCFSCHETAMMSDDPGMPEPDSCAVCHDEIDADKPEDERVETLFTDGVFDAARASALDDELVFSHKLHASGDQECSACHTGIESNRRVGPELAVPMDDCMACHAGREVANDCETCHVEIREDWAPDSHHHNWMRFHGQVARSQCTRPMDKCELCHTEATCVQCHLEEPPQNHTAFFRRRGHGVIAMMDRGTCAACHQPDSCERCHAEVVPMNHTGMWGGTKSRHCLTCHLPLKAEGCVVCHKSTPSHLSTPKPPDHNPAMNCRLCHGAGQRLPHVDNGDDCNQCHP